MQRYEDTVSRVDTGIGSYTEYCMKKSEQGSYVLYDDAQAEIARLTAERDQALARASAAAMEMREALLCTASSLAAAISLLERGGKSAKKAAPSDKMFDQMLVDYRASLVRARATLPIPTDAQEALDKLLTKAREDAIREAAHLIECDGDVLGGKSGAAKAIRALLNDGGRDE